MNNIIANIKGVFFLGSAKFIGVDDSRETVIECNYQNNYYGDQYCQLKK